jgi:hypothetical protein
MPYKFWNYVRKIGANLLIDIPAGGALEILQDGVECVRVDNSSSQDSMCISKIILN